MTSTYGRYHEDKHKINKDRHYLKAHICSGVYTNVVTAVVVTDEYGADTVQFAELVQRTAEDFEINEVSADKAYSSRKNHDIIGEIGGTPFIPFKKNTTGKAGGSHMWKKAYFYSY